MKESNIYTDILRKFTKDGHMVYAVSPVERRYHGETKLIRENNSMLLLLRTGNIQKTNFIEKGISTLAIEQQFIDTVKRYFHGVKFDLVLYATPPITFYRVIEYVKKRDGAKTYLMLKDIFPQNAVDIGMMSTQGIKGLLYRFFSQKEQRLYQVSDFICCMSPANAAYIRKHHSCLPSEKSESAPTALR